jgi:hypothetical protein
VNTALNKDLERQAGRIEKIARSIAAVEQDELFEHDQMMQEMENQIKQAKSA